MKENQLLTAWGFESDAPEQLREHAKQAVRAEGLTSGDLVVAQGLATRETVEELALGKPHNTLFLESLAEKIPEIRQERQRLLAVKFRLPYFEVLGEQDLHPLLEQVPAVRQRCAELNALLIETPDKIAVLAFADYDALAEYAQMGRIEAQADPIQQALSRHMVLGLASPGVLMRLTQWDSDNSGRVLSASTMDNFWTTGMARTEGERLLARVLDYALMRKATDVSIVPQVNGTASVMVRIYGELTPVEICPVLSVNLSQEISRFLLSKSRAGDGGRLREPADGQFTYKGSTTEVYIRSSFIPADRFGMDQDRISVSLRILPRATGGVELATLNLQQPVLDAIKLALMRSQGLIVLAGPTNSGKSTTIAGLVSEHISMFGDSRKRISLEEPVERQLAGITQISVANNFAALMRAILRHDPDLVWVGEIRDGFSASACVRAATSGHLVLSTVHANDAILAFRAIGNYLTQQSQEAGGSGASKFDLAESLTLLIGQRLVKQLCPHCKTTHVMPKEQLDALALYLEAETSIKDQQAVLDKLKSSHLAIASPGGCAHCQNTGFKGEVPISEVLPVTRVVRGLFSTPTEGLDYAALTGYRGLSLFESALGRVVAGEAEPNILFI